jgi:hypothetical protein
MFKSSYHLLSHPVKLKTVAAKLDSADAHTPLPEFIDQFSRKQAQNARLTENERFGLVVAKTGSINSGTGLLTTFF